MGVAGGNEDARNKIPPVRHSSYSSLEFEKEHAYVIVFSTLSNFHIYILVK